MAGSVLNEQVLLTREDLFALPSPIWLIDQILPERAFCVLYGQPGAKKSFVALSISLSIAAGDNWCDRTTISGSVLYVAAEGLYGMIARVQAYEKRHSIEAKDIRFHRGPLNLTDAGERRRLTETLKATDFHPSLIVLDTLAKVMPGADENSVKDMGNVVANIDALRHEISAAVIVVHHTGKDGSSERGSSALRGAADVMVKCCEEKDGCTTLTCDKSKDAEPFSKLRVKLDRVDLGSSGASLAVVSASEGGNLTTSNTAEAVLIVLQNTFRTNGATHGDWMAAVVSSGKSPASFARALRELKERKRVRLEGDKYHPHLTSLQSALSVVC